ncbi:MAG TPA: hypothetical protein VGV09_21210, partial [Steroidobacteraceae bacterium]|nr:hypothetical protein [Steroidobacteraceae bacterium]
MAPQSNPDSLTPHPDGSSEDSPSQDDLMALVPDMELLETSKSDALSAHAAMAAAAGSGRKQGPTPKLTDRSSATATVRTVAPQAPINDDPYADLMPELEPFEAPAATVRAIIPDANLQSPAPVSTPHPAPPARPAAPAPTPSSPPVRTPVAA